jgi:hypothetical protein
MRRYRNRAKRKEDAVSLETHITRLIDRITAKIERQYRDDAELLVAGVILRVRNPGGPASTHYIFEPTSHREAIELLDEPGAR